jgi:hypothetical protein
MNVSLVNVVEFEPINDFLNGRREQAHSAYPPIGLLTLAAVLERQRHEVEVVDCANLILQENLSWMIVCGRALLSIFAAGPLMWWVFPRAATTTSIRCPLLQDCGRCGLSADYFRWAAGDYHGYGHTEPV